MTVTTDVRILIRMCGRLVVIPGAARRLCRIRGADFRSVHGSPESREQRLPGEGPLPVCSAFLCAFGSARLDSYRSPHFSLLCKISKYVCLAGRTSRSESLARVTATRSPCFNSIPICPSSVR
jgi:hypothetical protein